ncbi:MAG: hypothetical protein BWK72_20720 [Rhodoferax ferrireducens]|uniref:Uncharacterized protein n=1 Tax=Rhodoferax ferrireducens TaxID=192843 RepID=A0A1W9KNR4_9BURK|nr:MAG: hypothetical protein BWK72_20720 [Rhodoferax ferrireducens]
MAEKKATAKKTPAATPAKADTNGYKINAEEWGFTKGDTDSQVMAALSTRSALTATTYKAFSGGGDGLEVTDVMGELRKAGEEVSSGNMSRVEKMLTQQALTLDAIFNNMAQRSHKQDSFKGIEVLMRLALKAQAQSRATVEALAEIKNPKPVTFVKQANMSQGHQQVNNTYAGASLDGGIQSRTENSHSEQNKLLEVSDGNYLDFGAQAAAS